MATENIFLTEATKIQEELTQWRRSLHQIPEVGTNLPQTMAYIKDRLEEMDISYQFYPEISCIMATIGTGEKCFLLRSDADGIPVTVPHPVMWLSCWAAVPAVTASAALPALPRAIT